MEHSGDTEEEYDGQGQRKQQQQQKSKKKMMPAAQHSGIQAHHTSQQKTPRSEKKITISKWMLQMELEMDLSLSS